MPKKLTFRELEINNRCFFIILAVLGFFITAAIGSFFYIEHHGHYVTGMNNQVVWGMPHVFAIFLIIAASGAANIGSIGVVFNQQIYQPLGRLSLVVAMALLVGGVAVLVFDLGRADRLIIALTHYNYKSIFAWNILLYNGFLVVMGAYLWSMMDRRKIAKAAYKSLAYIGFVWRFILTAGTGSIFGVLVARQYYDAAILAPLFIAASYVFGTAVFAVVLNILYSLEKRKIDDEIQSRLRYTLAIFIVLVLFFEIIRHVTNLYSAGRYAIEAYILVSGDKITWLFWLGQIGFGSLLPLVLIWLSVFKNNQVTLLLAASLVILGGLSQLYVLIIGGQLYPLALFPDAVLDSVYFDGGIASYSASWLEFSLGFGGVSLALLLIFIAAKNLCLVPESFFGIGAGEG